MNGLDIKGCTHFSPDYVPRPRFVNIDHAGSRDEEGGLRHSSLAQFLYVYTCFYLSCLDAAMCSLPSEMWACYRQLKACPADPA